jgi:hypothetical protein
VRDQVLVEARRIGRCAECDVELDHRVSPRSAFCSPKCRYRFRDRRKYAADPEAQRARARAYYAENRERVLEKSAAKRGGSRLPESTSCSECGAPLGGRQRVVCGKRRCVDARYRRLHPEAFAERERRKTERRRLARANR